MCNVVPRIITYLKLLNENENEIKYTPTPIKTNKTHRLKKR